jgi:hypothetical protein
MNYVLERMWKEAVMVCFELCWPISGMTKGNYEKTSQDVHSMGSDLSLGPPEYEAVVTT